MSNRIDSKLACNSSARTPARYYAPTAAGPLRGPSLRRGDGARRSTGAPSPRSQVMAVLDAWSTKSATYRHPDPPLIERDVDALVPFESVTVSTTW